MQLGSGYYHRGSAIPMLHAKGSPAPLQPENAPSVAIRNAEGLLPKIQYVKPPVSNMKAWKNVKEDFGIYNCDSEKCLQKYYKIANEQAAAKKIKWGGFSLTTAQAAWSKNNTAKHRQVALDTSTYQHWAIDFNRANHNYSDVTHDDSEEVHFLKYYADTEERPVGVTTESIAALDAWQWKMKNIANYVVNPDVSSLSNRITEKYPWTKKLMNAREYALDHLPRKAYNWFTQTAFKMRPTIYKERKVYKRTHGTLTDEKWW